MTATQHKIDLAVQLQDAITNLKSKLPERNLIPIDKLTFDIYTPEGIAELVSLKDREAELTRADVSKKEEHIKECIKYLNSHKDSYKEGNQLQTIILHEPFIGACGCMGADEGYTLCGCAMTNAIYKYRYHLYQHFQLIAAR